MGLIYRPFACGCVLMMATWGDYAGGYARVEDHIETACEECERWMIPDLLRRGWVDWEELAKKLDELTPP